jgi:hypothetical protein
MIIVELRYNNKESRQIATKLPLLVVLQKLAKFSARSHSIYDPASCKAWLTFIGHIQGKTVEGHTPQVLIEGQTVYATDRDYVTLTLNDGIDFYQLHELRDIFGGL